MLLFLDITVQFKKSILSNRAILQKNWELIFKKNIYLCQKILLKITHHEKI